MKLAAICCTYKRPRLLEQAIECFLRQDYPTHLRELVILDDAGQYKTQFQDGWFLFSTPTRFRTMGEKRNAALALAGDVDGYCVWDDDDIYLPWHMSTAARALKRGDYSLPSLVYLGVPKGLHIKQNKCLYHGAWSFRREAAIQVRGYPFTQAGQDQGLMWSFKKAKLLPVDPISEDARPSYIYRWFTDHKDHISQPNAMSYEDRAKIEFQPVDQLKPHWAKDWIKLQEQAAIA